MFNGKFCRVQSASLRFMTVCVETSLNKKPASKQVLKVMLCLNDKCIIDQAEKKVVIQAYLRSIWSDPLPSLPLYYVTSSDERCRKFFHVPLTVFACLGSSDVLRTP